MNKRHWVLKFYGRLNILLTILLGITVKCRVFFYLVYKLMDSFRAEEQRKEYFKNIFDVCYKKIQMGSVRFKKKIKQKP